MLKYRVTLTVEDGHVYEFEYSADDAIHAFEQFMFDDGLVDEVVIRVHVGEVAN